MRYIFSFLLLLAVSHAMAQHSVPKTNAFTVVLMDHKQVKFDIADIKKFPEANLGDISIKNHKGEDKNKVKEVKGVLLRSIFEKAPIVTNKPKELSELYIVLIASDGYKNVYSWNEIFNTEVGERLYIVTEIEGKNIEQMEGALLVMSLGDKNTGSRHLRGLERIEVRKVE